VAPYRVAAAPSSQGCPRCPGVALSRRGLGHVGVDECPRCRGVFVGADTLATLVEDLGLYEAVRTAYPGGPAPGGAVPGPFYVRCPVCDDVMNRRLFAPRARVVVDVCQAHGTWFDARELPAVIEYVERGGLEEVRAEQARRTAQRQQARVEVAMLMARGRGREDRTLADVIVDALAKWF
jgi:Zn-finger nucleic acid-binding protein